MLNYIISYILVLDTTQSIIELNMPTIVLLYKYIYTCVTHYVYITHLYIYIYKYL